VPSLTLFGLEMQKIYKYTGKYIGKALRRLWFKNKQSDINTLLAKH